MKDEEYVPSVTIEVRNDIERETTTSPTKPVLKSAPIKFNPDLVGRGRSVGSRSTAVNVEHARGRVDGRSARATGQSAQMNVKVTPEIRQRYQDLVKELGAGSLGELVTEALELLIAIRRPGWQPDTPTE